MESNAYKFGDAPGSQPTSFDMINDAKFQTPKGPNLFHHNSHMVNNTCMLSTPDNDSESKTNKSMLDSS